MLTESARQSHSTPSFDGINRQVDFVQVETCIAAHFLLRQSDKHGPVQRERTSQR